MGSDSRICLKVNHQSKIQERPDAISARLTEAHTAINGEDHCEIHILIAAIKSYKDLKKYFSLTISNILIS